MVLIARKVRHPAGHMTTMKLAPAFWSGLADIARREGITRDQIITRAHRKREDGLSEAVRVYALIYYRRALAACEARAKADRP